MLDRVNREMKSTGLKIAAKQNNMKIYLIEYKHKNGVGFVIDLDKGIRYADDEVRAIRKKGFWLDIYCSENVEKRILEKIAKLEAAEV